MTKTHFAKKLLAWRGPNSQDLAARALGRPLATYRNWEQARSMPKGATLEIILLCLRNPVQTSALQPTTKG